jgi:hypothetical protein
MKYTNKFLYPEPFARAVTLDTYDKGEADFTVSELISPPRLRQLVSRHDADITVDVSERLWIIMGTVAHDILERAGKEGQELTEERLYATVAGKKVGGKLDTLCLTSGLMTDYKVTSAWSYVFGDKPEWERQLNAYAFLARENGHKVEALQIFAMFRDWSPSKSLTSDDYPKTNCLCIPIPMWTHDEARIYLAGRVLAHSTASTCPDDDLVPCTPEERWAKKTTYAVMKPGRKSALSVHDTEQEAWKAMGQGLTVETRPGKSVRCESYCAARDFCNVWKNDPTNHSTAAVSEITAGVTP